MGLTYDWNSGVKHLLQVDPRFRDVTRRHPDPLQIRRARSTFEYLLRSIIYQQLSGKAAATIHRRACSLFPRQRPGAALALELSEEDWRSAGVSRGKCRAIRDLSRHQLEGALPGFAALQRLGDDEIIDRLTEIHGIGRWTVEMLLLFQLGRPDVFPLGDLGVRKGFARIRGRGGEVSPAQLKRAGKKWMPYRSVASWYCYRALDE